MPTIVVPTQAQLAQAHNNPTSLLAMYQAAKQPTPTVGSPSAVTGANTTNPQLNNLNNPDWITAMSDMINQINTKAQQEANAARIPGAAAMEKTSSGNIASMLQGNVPADVYREMAQKSAERGVSTGSPMGANSTADIMRALGLTSLDMTNQGQKLLTEAYGRNPAAPLANPQALVTTPAQAEALRLQQENLQLDYIAKMAAINEAANRTRTGYGGVHTPSGGSGGFNPATNWYSGGAPTMTATPTPTGWNLPPGQTRAEGYNPMSEDYLDQFYGGTNPVTPPANTYYNPNTNTSDYNPFGTYFTPGGGIDQGGMSQDELDWLYNVGG